LRLPERFGKLKPEQQSGALTALEAVDVTLHQAILDEWDARCRANTVRNPASYLFGIVQKALRGDFHVWAGKENQTNRQKRRKHQKYRRKKRNREQNRRQKQNQGRRLRQRPSMRKRRKNTWPGSGQCCVSPGRREINFHSMQQHSPVSTKIISQSERHTPMD
jgi:hypothetical protein